MRGETLVLERERSREREGGIYFLRYAYVCARVRGRDGLLGFILRFRPSSRLPISFPDRGSGIPRPRPPTPLDSSKTFTVLYNYLDRDSMVLPHLHLRLDFAPAGRYTFVRTYVSLIRVPLMHARACVSTSCVAAWVR